METIWLKLKQIKNGIIFLVILFLVAVIYFKNNKINNLKEKLAEKPQIEYVYNNSVDTITDSIPVPVEIIRWRTRVEKDTAWLPLDLSVSDSAQIAEAYNKLYDQFADIKVYDDTLKNDTTAFITLYEETQYNRIQNRKFIFEDRTPVVVITKTKVVDKNKFSIVGGLDGNFDAIKLGAGVVTRKNSVYLFKYDPFNKVYEGSFFLPIFNF